MTRRFASATILDDGILQRGDPPPEGGTRYMGDALAATVLVALLATVPAAAASSQGAKPLPVIGRVRVTTPLCRALLGEALRAVQIESENDTRIDTAVASLRSSDFDSSPVQKHRAVQDLTRQFTALRAAAVDGNATVRAFRDKAQAASATLQRKQLTAFANALDGALHRQRLLADDIGKFIAFLDAHDPMTNEEHDQATFDAIANENDARLSTRTPFDPRDFGPTAAVRAQLSTVAKGAANQLATRALPLTSDESDASDRIEPAFTGC